YISFLEKGKQKELIGLKTGFPKFDRATKGIDGLVVLSGLPGKGKTSFALQIGYEAVKLNKISLLYCSLEMNRRELYLKLLSRLSGISNHDLKLMDIRLIDEKKYKQAIEELKEFGKYIIIADRETVFFDLKAIEGIGKKLKDKTGTERIFIIIDYLQVFPLNEKNFSSQSEKINYLVTHFRRIQEDLNATVLLISHKVIGGNNIFESILGCPEIEYSVDSIFILETEEERKAKEKEKRFIIPEFEFDENSGELILVQESERIDLVIAKNRFGPPGRIKYEFRVSLSKFIEL
ncbi:DnaB helicase C-terminal domain-containing protein, partial [SCandidatus Aminicenantes bacterium Aminicenantia_JdfR_composite]|nr:DnaB helicase C-terminal domain-containing protein [SCandidatus Aminicenantes bacterium Aminicenantia_JdfR_composite]